MLTLIAAVDRHSNIGSSTGTPWYSPADLRFFREETMGGTLLVEYEQLQGFDPAVCFVGREVLIIDPQKRPRPAGTLSFPDADTALKYCWQNARSRVYAIGGAKLYDELLPKAWRVLLSRAKQAIPDTEYPQFPCLGKAWKSTTNWLLDCGVVPLVSEYVRKL